VGSGYAGAGMGKIAGTWGSSIGEEVGRQLFNAGASYTIATTTALTNQAVWTDEGLTGENWDETMLDTSRSFAISYGSSLVGREIAGVGGEGSGSSTLQQENSASQSTSSGGSSEVNALPENPYSEDFILSLPGTSDLEFNQWFDGATAPGADPANSLIYHKTYVENPQQLNCFGWASGRGNLVMPRNGFSTAQMLGEMGYSVQTLGQDVHRGELQPGDIALDMRSGNLNTKMNATYSNVDVHARRVTGNIFGTPWGEEMPGKGYKPEFAIPGSQDFSQHPPVTTPAPMGFDRNKTYYLLRWGN